MSFLSDATGINVDPGAGKASATPGGFIGLGLGGIPGAILGNKIGDMLNPQTPGFNPTPLDSTTQGLINQRRDESQQMSSGDFANRINQNTSGAGQMMAPSSKFDQENASLGSKQDPSLSAAISAKASRSFDKSLGQLQNQAQMQGIMEKQQRVSEAANMKVNLANLQRGLDTRVAQYQTAADATRYAVINGLFSGAGNAAGMAMAMRMSQMPAGSNPMEGADNMFAGNGGGSAGYAGPDAQPTGLVGPVGPGTDTTGWRQYTA